MDVSSIRQSAYSRKASRCLWNEIDYSESDFAVVSSIDERITPHARVRGKQRGLSEAAMVHGSTSCGTKIRQGVVRTFIPPAWKANAGKYHLRAEIETEKHEAYGKYFIEHIMIPPHAKRVIRQYATSCMSKSGNDNISAGDFVCTVCYGCSVLRIKGIDAIEVQEVLDNAKAIVDRAYNGSKRMECKKPGGDNKMAKEKRAKKQAEAEAKKQAEAEAEAEAEAKKEIEKAKTEAEAKRVEEAEKWVAWKVAKKKRGSKNEAEKWAAWKAANKAAKKAEAEARRVEEAVGEKKATGRPT